MSICGVRAPPLCVLDLVLDVFADEEVRDVFRQKVLQQESVDVLGRLHLLRLFFKALLQQELSPRAQLILHHIKHTQVTHGLNSDRAASNKTQICVNEKCCGLIILRYKTEVLLWHQYHTNIVFLKYALYFFIIFFYFKV